tara:strand:- start:7966 stop:8859 length:894 start_codon:yes stop_codon:yes gene_type:complete
MSVLYILILILIFVLIGVYLIKNKKNVSKLYYNKESVNISKKNYKIWLYWENIPGKEKPIHIDLCQRSIIKNSGMETIILDNKNLYKYLPNIRMDINNLSIPHKADYIRICILQKYGGMWLDSDIIVFKSLKPLLNKLSQYDYVGFGCHNALCKYNLNGKNKPANWAIISRENGIFITECLKEANKLLESNINLNRYFNYHKIGRELLWSVINKLQSNNWDYYHVSSANIERDKYGNKYNNERLISKELLSSNHDAYFTPLYNTAPGFPDWFLNMSEDELLNDNMLISQMLIKALKK